MTSRDTKKRSIDYADMTVLLVLTGLVVLYGLDSVRASTHVLNLIFVLPVTVIVLTLCLLQFIRQLLGRSGDVTIAESAARVLPVMILFSTYVLTLNWLGFDVGTMLFIGVFLWLHGERRIPWLFGYAIAFGMLMALFFSMMLPYPMPMLILDSAY